MSYVGLDATRWAWSVPVNSSSERLVLLALAKHDGDDDCPNPSAETLSEETKLNRKTIFAAIASLCGAGFVVRSTQPGHGRRNHYELNLTSIVPKTERAENGTYRKRNVPKTVLESSQKRNDHRPENGTNIVPFTGREYIYKDKDKEDKEDICVLPALDAETHCIDTNPSPAPIDDVPFPDFEEPTSEELFNAPLVDEAKPRDEPQPEAKPKAKRTRAMPKTRCPFDERNPVVPPEWLPEFEEDFPSINVPTEFRSFVSYHVSKGSTFANWRSAFRNWLNNAVKYQARDAARLGGAVRPTPNFKRALQREDMVYTDDF